METIKVNMSPNPLDVQTIHASQNDGEAREWGFALHNNGDAIDSSSISDQLVFKSYKGGTEQILPENGAVPVTAPFVGDIKYPDATRTDQEFTYRQSPTEEDGLAKITDIKGNTLVWNQLATFATESGTDVGIAFEFKADGTIVFNGTATDAYYTNIGNTYNIQGHKLYIKGCPSGGSNSTYYLRDGYNGVASERDFGNGAVVTARAKTILQIQILPGVTVTNLTFTPQMFDLTAMGLDTLTDDEVKQWFSSNYPLPYYQYDSGSLLPFRGEGLKIVGKNLLVPTATFPQTTNGVTFTLNSDGSVTANGTANGAAYVVFWGKTDYQGNKLLENGDYLLNGVTGGSLSTYCIRANGFDCPPVTGGVDSSFSITDSLSQTNIILYIADGYTADNVVFKPMIRRANVTDNTFEPYTSSTLSLPISTYFPTGMKSAGTVYDELLPTKAITRIGAVTVDGTNNDLRAVALTNVVRITVPIDTAKYNSNQISNNLPFLVSYTSDTEHFYVSDTYMQLFIGKTKCGSTLDSVKQYLSYNPTTIYFELATPTETSFTTASLVTENAEIPLSNEDGVLIGKCTEELSDNPGFIDAKIKLSDSDGTCYSNKLQLHVERSPQ